ncbi:MAG: sugar ABC transporter ATP-binding protein [Christensenella hongkongensis]|uniref:sugar ABC transporter ATP-binding protein n=1 Tax=Christensenella hongkongensis TaxID=270498 RepID=UPI0026728221|nr:sugar ABC transporter ATP-binding protein [Christensenella hongkongensis]MDY3003667.1 sugar ABC transporter ATP-binding protein [Christensenella hongkongensis]
MVNENILELKGITKLYPGVKALDNVSLSFRRGEVHALVGENGAGKSTLIKTISGAIEPSAGTITVEGKTFEGLTPTLSRENGIAVVYQEFTLVPVLSAAENIFLGEFIRKGWICNRKAMNEKAAELFKMLKIKLEPEVKVEDLTTGYQQIVEIAKAVAKDAKILIMDEPSAPLTTNEVEAMFGIVDTLKEQGVTVIYISHRLEEIFRVADRVSVLRDGAYIATKDIGDTNKDDLISLMVGRTLKETYPERDALTDEVVLSVRNLSGNGVKDISFDLKKGEILGFGGLVGAGRTELAALLFGNAKITGGEMLLKDKKISPKTPEGAIASGISLVPEDRKNQGLILDMTIKENITAASMKRLSKKGFVNKKAEEDFTTEYVRSLNIKTPGIHQKVKNLSGGNQQKVVLGKWMGTDPDILIFDEPTRGIDVGAKQEIYKLMVDITRKGKSIIMISSDMEELLGMSDRMVILSKGRMSAILDKDEFTQEKVLKYAAEGEDDGTIKEA